MAGRTLASYVHVNGQVYGPDSDVPKDVAEQITNPRAWSDDASEGNKGYDGQKVDELTAEAEKRGLTVEGTGKDGKVVKNDLIAALEADDAVNA